MEYVLLLLIVGVAAIYLASTQDDHTSFYFDPATLRPKHPPPRPSARPYTAPPTWSPRADAPPNFEEAWPYYAKPLMTEVEQIFFQRLLKVVPRHRVFAQVQLSQLLGVRSGHNYHRWYHHVSRMSVDYVICNTDARILAAIELDDSSHLRPDRIDADRKKDKALRDAGIRIVRIPVKGMPDVNELSRILSFLDTCGPEETSRQRSSAPGSSSPNHTSQDIPTSQPRPAQHLPDPPPTPPRNPTTSTLEDPGPTPSPSPTPGTTPGTPPGTPPDPSPRLPPEHNMPEAESIAQRRAREAPIPPLVLPPLETRGSAPLETAAPPI